MSHDVVSIGNPLMDILIDVEEGFLKELGLVKGSMHILTHEEISRIEEKLDKNNIKLAPGGSEANTLAALSMLGHKTVYFGKVGKDPMGDDYNSRLLEHGVISRIIKVDGITGRAITFITPDSERTFATHLGVSTLLEDSEINEADIMEAKFLHLTGYVLEGKKTKKAAIEAMDIAKSNNVKICLDLADSNIVKRNKEFLSSVIRKYADIVIANESEAREFTGKEAEQAIDELSEMSEIAVIKLGERGSLIKERKGSLIRIGGFKVDAIDTTGAGDAYTAGFLCGLLNNLDLETSGRIASFISSKVVEVKGARLCRMPLEEIERLRTAK